MAYYTDLREHIKALEAKKQLVRMKREINKDTELMPLVRWQFRGLPEEQRKAFLFENVVDTKGKKYNIPVLVGCHAASREIYSIGMKCKPEEIMERWVEAERHPIQPEIVETGPVHDVVHMGDSLLEHGGLDEIPIPISIPGFDNAPYLTAANWVSKDPETGTRNIGNYRGMLKSRTRLGMMCSMPQHLRVNWEKCKRKGVPLQVAAILGATPNVAFTAVTKIPYGTDEYTIAGGLAGEPVKLVKCKTVDIEVPATAEIVIEGEVPTDYLEREGPFGEHTGYVMGWGLNLFVNVTCITHRKNPIYNAFISQFAPSESSKIKKEAREGGLYKFLKYDCNITGILDVAVHEASGGVQFCVIKMSKMHPAQPWQALNVAAGYDPGFGKIMIAVDEDIDARDIDSVVWALCYRIQPHRDIQISAGKLHQTDPSSAAPLPEGKMARIPGSALLIDATMKWPYPPTALPRKEFMERARQIWEEEGLPKLSPKVPWHGYELGFWPEEMAEEAELAVKGDYFRTGEKLAGKRVKV